MRPEGSRRTHSATKTARRGSLPPPETSDRKSLRPVLLGPFTLGPFGVFLLAERRKPPGFPTVIPARAVPLQSKYRSRNKRVRRGLGNGMPTACPWEFHVRRYTGGHPQTTTPFPSGGSAAAGERGGGGEERSRVAPSVSIPRTSRGHLSAQAMPALRSASRTSRTLISRTMLSGIGLTPTVRRDFYKVWVRMTMARSLVANRRSSSYPPIVSFIAGGQILRLPSRRRGPARGSSHRRRPGPAGGCPESWC